MSVRNTQICCCGASTWTAVFGWIQTVLSILIVIGAALLLAGLDSDAVKNDTSIDPDDRKVAYGVTWALLVVYLVNVLLGIMLIIGNKREKVKLLWIWLVLTAVSQGISIIMGIVSATTGDSTQIISVCISAAITAFIIFCVYKRIQDIKFGISGGQGYAGAA